MKSRIFLLAGLVLSCTLLAAQSNSAQTGDTKMNDFVSNLMAKMTLEEKLGQLNLPGAGDITTGQARSSSRDGAGRAGVLHDASTYQRPRTGSQEMS